MWFGYDDLANEQRSPNNTEARTMMMKTRNAWTWGSTLVLLLTLALPISAGAFGDRPSPSEVFDQPGKMASPTHMASADVGGASVEKVPEPSSLLFVGIALGMGVLVAIWKWRRQTTEQGQAE